MPSLRVVTWNSGGEAGARGAALTAAVLAANATAPPVDLMAIQEAKVAIVPPGSIYTVLTAGAAPFAGFPLPNHPQELNPAPKPPYSVGKNKSYLIPWQPGTVAAPWLVSAGAAARIPLNAVVAPANGVENYIQGLGVGGPSVAALRLAAANIRPPVRKVFTFNPAGGRPTRWWTLHLACRVAVPLGQRKLVDGWAYGQSLWRSGNVRRLPVLPGKRHICR